MLAKKRIHHPPKVPRRDGLQVLIDLAVGELAARGVVRVPAAPWLAAARVKLVTLHGCGWDMDTTEQQLVAQRLLGAWVHRWEADELVLELPGWVQPPPAVVAIQPNLFD